MPIESTPLNQVFYSSPWLPPEWIKAHGLEPRGVWYAAESGALPLAAGVCAFAESVVQLTDKHPNAAFIFSTHCDQLRRGFDAVSAGARAVPGSQQVHIEAGNPVPSGREGEAHALRVGDGSRSGPGRSFLFNLPATWQTPVAETLFVSELERLSRFLVGWGGQRPTAEALAEAMTDYSAARAQLIEAAAHLSARDYCHLLSRFHWNGTLAFPEDAPPPRTDGVPLAIVGGPLPRCQAHVLETIERTGGRIVLNATEAGERSLGSGGAPAFLPTSAEEREDADREVGAPDLSQLVRQLARSCLDNCVDVFQRPNTRLYDWLRARLVARKVCGIVLWHFVGCDLWRAEAQPLREAFGLPLLALDANDAAGDSLRQGGRIQAFLEALR